MITPFSAAPSGLRRAVSVIGVLIVALTSFALTAGRATASPTTPAYPPSTTCAISTTVVTGAPSPQLQVNGTGFKSGQTVTIVMHSGSIALGTATTNSAGAFSTTVSLPAGTSGTHSLSVTGESCPVDPSFTINGTTNATVQTSSGSLAFTGVAIAGYAVAAVLLIAGGVVLLMVSRRRRNAG